MSRSLGGRSLTTCPSILTVPEVIVSRPATIRRAVVLPQPEGPTKTTNSPLPTSRSRPLTASVPSGYTFVRFSMVISATRALPRLCRLATNLLASNRSHGGTGRHLETDLTALAARPREPSLPRTRAHRPGGHLHGARRRLALRLGDLPQPHRCDRRLALRGLGRLRQLHERLARR